MAAIFLAIVRRNSSGLFPLATLLSKYALQGPLAAVPAAPLNRSFRTRLQLGFSPRKAGRFLVRCIRPRTSSYSAVVRVTTANPEYPPNCRLLRKRAALQDK